jgi:magnesium transporter
MKANWYLIKTGHLHKQPTFIGWEATPTGELRGRWFDIQSAEPGELGELLAPFHLPPLLLEDFLAHKQSPKFFPHDHDIFISFPVLADETSKTVNYLSIIALPNILVTIQHGSIPAIGLLANELVGEKKVLGKNMSNLLLQMIQSLTDWNIAVGRALQNRVSKLSELMEHVPPSVDSNEMLRVGSQVHMYSTVIESQLRCVQGLIKTNSPSFDQSGLKEQLQKIEMDAENAHITATRCEDFMKELRQVHHAIFQERIEKQLRILTMILVIFLPLSLITNVFGIYTANLCSTSSLLGIAVALGIIVLIVLILIGYFRRNGWFD